MGPFLVILRFLDFKSEILKAQEILARLVSFPVLGGEPNGEIVQWIKSYLEGYGVEVGLLPNREGTKASLYCKIGPDASRGIILSGHMDVVPVKGQDWTSDPFTLSDKGDGRLYGRGTCDMKGFLASCLAVVPQMVKADLKRPVFLAFSYDEEIGCLSAPELAAHFRNYYHPPPKYALIGEPTMMVPTIGQKGICVLKTTISGTAGHSSRIKQEVSAIHESARAIMWLEQYMDRLVEQGRLDTRFSPPHTSIHIGQVKGGVAPNVIADKARFFWDVRTIPMDDIEDILSAFDHYAEGRKKALKDVFPGFEIITEKYHPAVPPLGTDESSEICQLIKEITGNDRVQTVSYAAEAGQFSEAGFQAIICGPGSIDQAHRADEYISKDQLMQGVQMIEKIVEVFSQR